MVFGASHPYMCIITLLESCDHFIAQEENYAGNALSILSLLIKQGKIPVRSLIFACPS
jgi:hypothetical protein